MLHLFITMCVYFSLFAQWCSKAFQNVTVIPPETGTVHQVNLEYLSRVVMEQRDLLYPDTVLGTDSHTTMLNGLGVLALGKNYYFYFLFFLTF